MDETKFEGDIETQKGSDAKTDDEIVQEMLSYLSKDEQEKLLSAGTTVSDILDMVKQDTSLKDYLLNHVMHIDDAQKIISIAKTVIENLDVGEALAPLVPRLVEMLLSYQPSDDLTAEVADSLRTIETEFESDDLTVGGLASDIVRVGMKTLSDMIAQDIPGMATFIQDVVATLYDVRPEWIANAKQAIVDEMISTVVAVTLGYDLKTGQFKGTTIKKSDPSSEFALYLLANAMGQDNWTKFIGGLAGAAPALDALLEYGASLNSVVSSILGYANMAFNTNAQSNDVRFYTRHDGNKAIAISIGPLFLSLALDLESTIAPCQYQVSNNIPIVAKRGCTWLGKALSSLFNKTVGKIINTGVGLYNDIAHIEQFKTFVDELISTDTALQRFLNDTIPDNLKALAAQGIKTLMYDALDLIIISLSDRLISAARDRTNSLGNASSLEPGAINSASSVNPGIVVDSNDSNPTRMDAVRSVNDLPSGDSLSTLQRALGVAQEQRRPSGFYVPSILGEDEYE